MALGIIENPRNPDLQYRFPKTPVFIRNDSKKHQYFHFLDFEMTSTQFFEIRLKNIKFTN